MDLTALSAREILQIPISRPERLYSNDIEKAKSEYHALSKRWHPDMGNDPEVFKHIKSLYDTAKERILNHTWSSTNKFLLHKDGKILTRAFHVKHTFELGEFYVGDAAITYVVRPEFEDFYNNAITNIKSFTYANDDMKKQISSLLPMVETSFKADEGLILVLKKTPDVLSLRDILTHLTKFDPRHVAWIYGRLCNICCYLQYIKMTHNAINPDTLFISPLYHSVALYGGWWYSSKIPKKKLLGLPQYSVIHGHPSIMRTKMPDNRNDLTLIRAIARELLGDVSAAKLRLDTTVPKGLVNWLGSPTNGVAVDDYNLWEKHRDTIFGPRKFIKMDISARNIYADSFV